MAWGWQPHAEIASSTCTGFCHNIYMTEVAWADVGAKSSDGAAQPVVESADLTKVIDARLYHNLHVTLQKAAALQPWPAMP